MHRLKLVEEEMTEMPVNQGMPPLDTEGRAVSRFEFWPSWIFYTPVVIQWLWLGLKYRSFTLPLIANPGIELSGMVGESKHAILSLAGKQAKPWISPYIVWRNSGNNAETQAHEALAALHQSGLTLPVVAKPDLGCRGAGVWLIESKSRLVDYIEKFPEGARFLLQQKAPYSAEAGVFYVRYPDQKKGKIISLTLKYNPSVVGDGIQTLGELIDADARAGLLRHLYRRRHEALLDTVLDEGEEFRLAFAGSHCRGAIFRDGNAYITQALGERLDEIFDDFPGYHYGRLDIKFGDIDSLMAGKEMTLLEVNGASSEAAHIWDRDAKISEAFSTLLAQYRVLFEIGAMQRDRGHKTPSLRELYHAWRKEKRLITGYPDTD